MQAIVCGGNASLLSAPARAVGALAARQAVFPCPPPTVRVGSSSAAFASAPLRLAAAPRTVAAATAARRAVVIATADATLEGSVAIPYRCVLLWGAQHELAAAHRNPQLAVAGWKLTPLPPLCAAKPRRTPPPRRCTPCTMHRAPASTLACPGRCAHATWGASALNVHVQPFSAEGARSHARAYLRWESA